MVDIETYIKEKVALIIVKGDVDASSSIHLDESLNNQLTKKEYNVVIDCTELHYISSAGLGVFMSYIEEFKGTNQKFVLYGLSEKVKNVFEMLGLDQLMNLLETKEEAYSFVNEN